MSDVDVTVRKKERQGIASFIVGLAPELIGFQEFGARIACFILCPRWILRFHSGQSRIKAQRMVGRKKWG